MDVTHINLKKIYNETNVTYELGTLAFVRQHSNQFTFVRINLDYVSIKTLLKRLFLLSCGSSALFCTLK